MFLKLEKNFSILNFLMGRYVFEKYFGCQPVKLLLLLLFALIHLATTRSSHQQTSRRSTHIFIGDKCMEGIPMHLFYT